MKLHSKFTCILMLLFSINMSAQISQEQLLKAWDNMTNMVVKTAEAMPAENYTYKPTKELRDFANQVGHIGGANYLFASVVKLERPSTKFPKTKDKKTIVQELKKSFAFIRGGMQKLTKEDLNEEFEFFGNKASRLQAILIMTSHLQREHGKSTIYTRLKNVAPARSGGW